MKEFENVSAYLNVFESLLSFLLFWKKCAELMLGGCWLKASITFSRCVQFSGSNLCKKKLGK